MNRLSRWVKNLSCGTVHLFLRAVGGPLLRPRWLWFEVTDRCNSRCMQCHIWRNKEAKEELTPAEIGQALKDPLFKDLEWIVNAGGEPALRQDLEEIVLAEHEAVPKAGIQISTNGLLPERIIGVVKTAIKHKIKIAVGTSLDGLGEDHDAVRGVKGNFEKVDRLLGELVALRKDYPDLSPSFGFTLIDRTLPYLDDVRRYAQKRGLGFAVQWYNQSPFFNNLDEDLVRDKAAMLRAFPSSPDSLTDEAGVKWLKGKSIRFSCFAMHTFCMMHSNGDISPCLGRWDAVAGNVRFSPPSRIWQSLEAKKIRGMVKECRGCLNACGVMWSADSGYYPELLFHLKQRFKH